MNRSPFTIALRPAPLAALQAVYAPPGETNRQFVTVSMEKSEGAPYQCNDY